MIYIPYSETFLALAIGIRFFQGLGSACIQVAAFSIVAVQFPNGKLTFFGYCESAAGFSMMGGPIVGQILYTAFGFQGCFFAIALLILGCGILTSFMIPSIVNRSRRDSPLDTQEEDGTLLDLETSDLVSFEAKTICQITYYQILTNKRAMLGVISCIFGTIFLLFPESVIS